MDFGAFLQSQGYSVQQKAPIDRSNLRLLTSLSREVDARVSVYSQHSGRVARWVKPVARYLGLARKEIQAAHWAALLHDVGKIGLPDKILTKKGSLSDQEWDWMKLHPVVGATLVNRMTQLDVTAFLIYTHHERFDGKGYPSGLLGDEIPIGARIISVADAYEAMTSDRVYRSSRSHIDAISELYLQSGSQFDPRVVREFMVFMEGGEPT
jgi:HD-GYP domain-containing protein (c-di-GMP phosphodiesterase class II)